ncbi:MAG TPA: M28 family peptidase [Bacteroidales bacterium]|nr:M28 family peptidase [Bacteroidales bacterium]HSA43134.1 M28 family peptidase [Bacteroidales bacterium]
MTLKSISLTCLLAAFVIFSGFSQDVSYARRLVDTLAAPGLHGRGYVSSGDQLAAQLIAETFQKQGLRYFGDSWFQDYSFPINTFPGTVRLVVKDDTLIPGRDFLVSSGCRSIAGTFPLLWMKDTTLTVSALRKKIKGMKLSNTFLVLERLPALMHSTDLKGVKGVILLREGRMVWSVSNARKLRKMAALEVQRDKLPAGTDSIKLSIDQEYVKKHRTRNVIAYIEGRSRKDSFLVVTAHYDHLGRMGSKTYFPGANDNASGTAMMLDLARHYALPENRPEYSMVFMAFSGEEAGLLGSRHYVKHPLFPLKQIRFLVNLDMVGTGGDGIGLVNGSLYGSETAMLKSINEANNYLKEIKVRGPSAHSDHHPFYEKGVPSVFIYTMGDNYKDYHNPDDQAGRLPYTGYDALFRLLTGFFGRLQSP